MNEFWKDVKGYEGRYLISSTGKVKSIIGNKEIILKQFLSGIGYNAVNLCKDGKRKKITIHQLVAITFLGHKICGHKLVVDHINDIKTDNRVENLQIITQRENSCKTQGKYSSKYKGVNFYKKTNKWLAHISINGTVKHLGYFKNEHDAHLAYVKALNN
jgi:hypothetical protein